MPEKINKQKETHQSIEYCIFFGKTFDEYQKGGDILHDYLQKIEGVKILDNEYYSYADLIISYNGEVTNLMSMIQDKFDSSLFPQYDISFEKRNRQAEILDKKTKEIETLLMDMDFWGLSPEKAQQLQQMLDQFSSKISPLTHD